MLNLRKSSMAFLLADSYQASLDKLKYELY